MQTVQTNLLLPKRRRRIFRIAVWSGRAIGGALILLAILGIWQAAFFPTRTYGSSFWLLSSLGIGLMGSVWILGLELFLRFFDRYLSRN